MERYLGLDPHARSCTFCVLNHTGKQLRRDVVETNGEALVGYLKQITGKLHLCIEEGEYSQWLVEILSPCAVEVVVLRGEKKRGSKSDAIDSHELAECIRTRKLDRAVYKDPRRFGALRELARTYTMLTQDVARTKNRLKSLLRARGVPVTGEAVYSRQGRKEKTRGLPAATRLAVELLGEELESLLELKEEARKAMLTESRRHKISRILETAPGLGPVRVAQMIPIVLTPHRFRTKRPFWAYCGFGVVVHSSSDWVREGREWKRARVGMTRGLNRNHNRMLKMIFKAAATTVIRHSRAHPLKEDYEQLLESGTKPNLAKLTIARKIAAIVLAMWKEEKRYQPERYRSVTAA
jgi:transposase